MNILLWLLIYLFIGFCFATASCKLSSSNYDVMTFLFEMWVYPMLILLLMLNAWIKLIERWME